MDLANQSGKGRLGFLLSLAIVFVICFLAVKIIPVRITAYNFRDVLREETRMAAVRKSDAVLAKRIMDEAEDLGIPLERGNLVIKRTKRRMTLSARYEHPIDLKLTTYVYKFRATEEAPLF